MRLVNDRLLSVWGYREKSESHNYIDIHKLHCTGASIIASILRRFEGPPRKKITGRRKKFVFQSVCVSTFYFLVHSFLSRNRCFSKGKNSSGVKRLVTYDSHKAEQKWHHVSQTHSALSLLLTYNALVSVLTHRPGGNLTADHRRQRTKSGKHWELHCSVRCCTSAGTDTEHTFLQEQMTDRLLSSWWFLINNAKRKGYFLFTMNMKCCVTGQLKDAWILNQWGFRVGGASETQTWQKRTVAQCLLTSLFRTKSHIYTENVAFTACRFIAHGWETVLPVRERDGGGKSWERQNCYSSGTVIWRAFWSFFSAPISPLKQRQMFKAWERCLSMQPAEIRYQPKFHPGFTLL